MNVGWLIDGLRPFAGMTLGVHIVKHSLQINALFRMAISRWLQKYTTTNAGRQGLLRQSKITSALTTQTTLASTGSITTTRCYPLANFFTGQTASFDTFDADIEYMGFYEFPIESLVVVSTPKTIEREWRFVAANKEIVSGCLYCESGNFESKPVIDLGAKQLAIEIVSSEYSPDPVWIIDICQSSDGAYHLLEIGGFSFADLYACDKSDIVSAVSAVALSQWQANDA